MKYKHDKNRFFPNEQPGIIERLLCLVFRVRIIPVGLNLYLRRIYLSPRWKWLPKKLFLHHIFFSDNRNALHSHPWEFLTIPLSNWYKEIFQTKLYSIGKHNVQETSERIVKRGQIVNNPLEHVHRLELTKPMWTFVIVGKAKQMWGFYPPEKDYTFVPWREYLQVPNAEDYPEDIF